jgi:hypothetical protein
LHPPPEPEPEPLDERIPAEKRRETYAAEADAFAREAFHYQTEADALHEAGDLAGAAAAEEKARGLRAQYLAKKREIRDRFPDPGPEMFYLASSGVYHRLDCPHAPEGAAGMTLAAVADAKQNARPCSKCNPPEMEDMNAG